MSTGNNDPSFCSYGCKIVFESLGDVLEHEIEGRTFGLQRTHADLAVVHGRSPYNTGANQTPEEHSATNQIGKKRLYLLSER